VPGIRGTTAGAFALDIEGTSAGFVKSVAGGEPYADVVGEPVGADQVVHKHLAGVKYEDITITIGLPSGAVATWISEFLQGSAPSRNGAIVFFDFNGKQVRRLEWTNGRISSVRFPELDASSKDAVSLTLVITPEQTRTAPGNGTVATTPIGRGSGASKNALAANFSLLLPGIDTTRVSHVDAITVSQDLVEDAVGMVRGASRTAGALRVGDLVVHVSAPGGVFDAWRDDFILNGNNGAAQEKQATLTWLSADLKTALMTLTLSGVGIHRLTHAPAAALAGGADRDIASMYCEQASLQAP
jgi:hypothetical protein